MDELKASIKECISKGVYKCNALKKLRREFPQYEKDISKIYEEVKEEMFQNKEWRAFIDGIPVKEKKRGKSGPKDLNSISVKMIEGEHEDYIKTKDYVMVGDIKFTSIEQIEEYKKQFLKGVAELKKVFKMEA